ncbi:MAG: PhoH family protein [Clostridiales bacterium]|nr:PhoH family protein [Clostridiales bacterium]
MICLLGMPLKNLDVYQALFGMNDQFINIIEKEFSVSIVLRDNGFRIQGNEGTKPLAKQVIDKLISLLYEGQSIDVSTVRYLCSLVLKGHGDSAEDIFHDIVAYTYRGQRICCKTAGQQEYVNAMRNSELTLAIGPAGTGKTYLAIALAVLALRNKDVERIILTRPAVEAGEKLGFLPGDMAQKIDPYLRPLYDALYDLMGQDAYVSLIEKGTIEVAPLAFMRGRTLNDAFIILDEAQNTSSEQMKMFLTRMGKNSRCVVVGDLTQIDLPQNRQSGLKIASEVLKDVEGLSIVNLTQADVVRNDLVQRIVGAYEQHQNHRSLA